MTLGSLLMQEALVDFVKIDVEGYEAKVWSGLQATLQKHPKCIVVIECNTVRMRGRAPDLQALPKPCHTFCMHSGGHAMHWMACNVTRPTATSLATLYMLSACIYRYQHVYRRRSRHVPRRRVPEIKPATFYNELSVRAGRRLLELRPDGTRRPITVHQMLEGPEALIWVEPPGASVPGLSTQG